MSAFSASAVITRTFRTIGQTLPSVGILIIGVQAVMAAFQFGVVVPGMRNAISGQGSPFALFSSPAYWAGAAISFVLFGFMFAGTIHGFLMAADGKQPTLADCLNKGIAKVGPVIAVSILWILGVTVGMIFLWVPGLILMTMWSVCLPVVISEDGGIIASFGRSRALTKGSRWKIFGLLLLFMVLYYALTFGVMGSTLSSVGPGAVTAATMASFTTAAMAGSLIVTTISLFILPALLASIYAETVKGEFGAWGENVTEVFS